MQTRLPGLPKHTRSRKRANQRRIGGSVVSRMSDRGYFYLVFRFSKGRTRASKEPQTSAWPNRCCLASSAEFPARRSDTPRTPDSAHVETSCMYVDIGLTSMYVCTSRWIARTKTRCMYVHVGWCSSCYREILISQVFVLVGEAVEKFPCWMALSVPSPIAHRTFQKSTPPAFFEHHLTFGFTLTATEAATGTSGSV